MYDVCIVGAGIIGCSITRELAKYKLKTIMLEKKSDVGAATTKANSGIVHGGYADKPTSVKAKFCTKGNLMYKKLNDELNFGFTQTGSFVIGFNKEDAEKIAQLCSYGQANGVPDLQIVDGDFVRKKEPHLNKDITIALYCPTAGITSPYEFAAALAENAIQNGSELKLNTTVTAIERLNDYFLVTTDKEIIEAKIIVNAAGLYADDIAKMVGLSDFTITPREGQYLLFDKDVGELVNSVIFQTPTAISKGILVTRTQHGNLLLGPDATVAPAKDYVDTEGQNINYIVETAKRTLPEFDMGKVITSFAGNRSASSTGDFVINETAVRGFINAAGIESPGLTAAPAIAEHVANIIKDTNLVKFEENKNFEPYRKPYNAISTMEAQKLNDLIKNDPDYGTVICRCETVSLGEVKDALHRNIPIESLDAIKRRTRAGMGRCQGGFCTPRLIDILSEELKIPKEKVTKKGGNSFLIYRKLNHQN